MQEIVYDESPYIPLVYPLDLEAADTGKWTGWVRAASDKGAWWYNTQMDSLPARSYPGGAETEEEGSNTGLIVGIVIAVLVVVALVVLLLRRERRQAEIEG